MPDLMEGDEVAHLAANRWDADLEPALSTAVAVADADHDRTSSAVDTRDPVGGAEIIDVTIECPRLHHPSVEATLEVVARCRVGTCTRKRRG